MQFSRGGEPDGGKISNFLLEKVRIETCGKSNFVKSILSFIYLYRIYHLCERAIVAMIVWWLDLQLPMQSVPITTGIVS